MNQSIETIDIMYFLVKRGDHEVPWECSVFATQ